jgi:anti-anti-sigma factor
MMFTKLFEVAAHTDRLDASPTPESVRPNPHIEVGIDEAPGKVVVRIAGEASLRQADKLTAALLGLSARRPSLVTLDLSRLSFLSSLAMGVLVAFRRGIVRAGGRVRLAAAPQEPVREALARAELLNLFGWPAEAEDCKSETAPPDLKPESLSDDEKNGGVAVKHIPKVQDLERAHGVTWGELAQLEPRLNELLWQARAEGARCCRWSDVERMFAPYRNAIAELVGFRSRHSAHSSLGSVGAYEVTYWRLYDAVCGLLPRPIGAHNVQERGFSASRSLGQAITTNSSWGKTSASGSASSTRPSVKPTASSCQANRRRICSVFSMLRSICLIRRGGAEIGPHQVLDVIAELQLLKQLKP